MRKNIFYISLIFLFIIFACSNENNQQNDPNKNADEYAVLVPSLNKKEVNRLSETLRTVINDTLITVKKKDNYGLRIGHFASKSDAVSRGFELFADSLIPSSFQVVFKDSELVNPYSEFYFVGSYINRPSLMKMSLIKIKPQLVWSRWGRDIINIDRSNDLEKIYILTSLKIGFKAGFPFTRNTRLYLFNKQSDDIEFVDKYGDGLQVTSLWESDSSYKVYFTKLDSFHTTQVIQESFLYDDYGNKLNRDEEVYNLIKDGLPRIVDNEVKQISPNLNYKMIFERKDTVGQIFLYDELNGKKYFIVNTFTKINKSDWSSDDKYLFITTQNERNEKQTELLIINTFDTEVVKSIKSDGKKNFLVKQNLLIFDDGFGKNSEIYFFRYRKNKFYNRLKINGGCGLVNIPKILD